MDRRSSTHTLKSRMGIGFQSMQKSRQAAKRHKKARALANSGFFPYCAWRSGAATLSGAAIPGGRAAARCRVSITRRFVGRTFRPAMLPFWRPAIGSSFLRRTRIGPRIRPRPVILWPLIPVRAATMHGRTRAFFRRPVWLSSRLPVAGRGTDFELVQLIPLFIGAIPFRDGIKFANPATRINRFWIIHGAIMNHTTGRVQLSQNMNHKARVQAL